jgi:hypothetical protein
MNRFGAAVRALLVDWRSTIGMAWGVLAAALAVTVVIVIAVQAQDGGDDIVTGGVFAIFGAVASSQGTAMTQVFPFAVGLGLTRRVFYAATVSLLAAQAVTFGIVLALLARLEAATDGWAIGMSFFRPAGFDPGLVPQAAVYAAGFLVSGLLMAVLGLVHHRWGTTGVWAAMAGGVIVIGLLAVPLILSGAGASLVDWGGRQPVIVVGALLPTLVAAVLAMVGWAGIRHAEP